MSKIDIPKRISFQRDYTKTPRWRFIPFGKFPKGTILQVLELEIDPQFPIPIVADQLEITESLLFYLDGLDWYLTDQPFALNCHIYYDIRENIIRAGWGMISPDLLTKRGSFIPLITIESDFKVKCPRCGCELLGIHRLEDNQIESFALLKHSKKPDCLFRLNPFLNYIYGSVSNLDLRFCLFCLQCKKAFRQSIDVLHQDFSKEDRTCFDFDELDFFLNLPFDEIKADEIEETMIIEYLQCGRFARAYLSLKVLLNKDPENLKLLSYLAMALEGRRRINRVMELYKTIVERSGHSEQAQENLFSFCLCNNQGEEALEELLSKGYITWAVFSSEKPNANALNEFELQAARWMIAQPKIDSLLENRQFKLARDGLRNYKPLGMIGNLEILKRISITAFFAEDYEECLSSALDFVRLGGIWEKTEFYIEEAYKAIRCRNLANDFRHEFTAMLKMAALKYDAKDFAEALKLAESCLELCSESAYALIEKGNALHMLGRYIEAIQVYEKAMELNPASANAYFNYASFILDTQTEISQLNKAYIFILRARRLGFSNNLIENTDKMLEKVQGLLISHYDHYHNECLLPKDEIGE